MTNRKRRIATSVAGAALLAAVLGTSTRADGQRALGLDISAWQGSLSAANWATIKRPTNQSVSGVFGDGRDFAFLRSSRGGTTGYYNQSNPNNNAPVDQNTLSQRYDDPYFVQNITRATAAGLFAAPYHFGRPDVVATTSTSEGIANTGTDEANHMIEMAGAWMRPGYLLPVFDLEAGISQRSSAQLTQFAIDFSNRINEFAGVRPIIYMSGNYAGYVESSAVAAFPNLWIARWPSVEPDVQTVNPNSGASSVYGKWDDFGDSQPWDFWQYSATGRLNGYANGTANVDLNVANGGTEFLKDLLVPARWTSNNSGQWNDLANWNSGQAPVAPVQGPGQVARVGPLTLPVARLPALNDTVILDRPGAEIVVTLDSGEHFIRKLVARETLNVSGASLTINYIPSAESTPLSAQFSRNITLSGAATLSAHTIQVDATRTLSVGNSTLVFNSIRLMPLSFTPAKITLTGDLTITPMAAATATIQTGTGSGSSPVVDLGGAGRVISVTDGPAAIDLLIDVPVSNGALIKSGAGTMRLGRAGTLVGGTTILEGTLQLGHANGVGAGGAAVVLNSGTLDLGGFSPSVTLSGAGGIVRNNGTAATLNLHAPAELTTSFAGSIQNGTGATALSVSGSGTLALTGGNSYTGATTINGPTVELSVAAGTHLPILGEAGAPGVAGANLINGRIVFNYAGTTSPADAVAEILDAGYDVLFATGRLRSSGVINSDFTLGWYDDGVSRLTVGRTLYGDANLDGIVNFSDLLVLAKNYNTTGSAAWGTGDFNYDQQVGFADLLALAKHYNQSMPATLAADWALAQALVPEPALATLLAAAGLILRRTRRPDRTYPCRAS